MWAARLPPSDLPSVGAEASQCLSLLVRGWGFRRTVAVFLRGRRSTMQVDAGAAASGDASRMKTMSRMVAHGELDAGGPWAAVEAGSRRIHTALSTSLLLQIRTHGSMPAYMRCRQVRRNLIRSPDHIRQHHPSPPHCPKHHRRAQRKDPRDAPQHRNGAARAAAAKVPRMQRRKESPVILPRAVRRGWRARAACAECCA